MLKNRGWRVSSGGLFGLWWFDRFCLFVLAFDSANTWLDKWFHVKLRIHYHLKFNFGTFCLVCNLLPFIWSKGQVSPSFWRKQRHFLLCWLVGYVYLEMIQRAQMTLPLPSKNLFCMTCCMLEGLGKQFCQLLLSTRVNKSHLESRVIQINHVIISYAQGK